MAATEEKKKGTKDKTRSGLRISTASELFSV